MIILDMNTSARSMKENIREKISLILRYHWRKSIVSLMIAES